MVTITDEQLKITRLNVFRPGSVRPVAFYMYGPIADETILAMEKFVTEKLKQDEFAGLAESVYEFMNNNNLQICYLN